MKKLHLLVLSLFALNLYAQPNLGIQLVKDGFDSPVFVTNDGFYNLADQRLYVVEQGGKIKILTNGITNPVPFLNISGIVSGGNEQGLLGLAFHPEYGTNGYFFVNYTKTNGDTQVSRFSVDPSNPDLANPNSELPIIGYDQPFSNHNGGHLAFGPDGYLYISSGDGGNGGDPGNRAQNINLLLGKILRLDVNNSTIANPYDIPADNPFVGNPNAREEIWAYGLRNPWRFSFDFEDNNLWIGDVGQSAIEEINKVSATEAGLNYGWRCYEGSQPFNTQNCPPQSELTFPLIEYTHANGNCSVTGGYLYRGDSFPDVYDGDYFFADYCSGKIGILDKFNQIVEEVYFTGKNWVSFGESANKELYVVDGPGGGIYSFTSILSTQDFSIENELAVFPNPASGNVTFSLKSNNLNTIQLYDIRGSLVFSEENISQNEKTISVEKLSSGIYFAKVVSEKGESVVKKLIIQ